MFIVVNSKSNVIKLLDNLSLNIILKQASDDTSGDFDGSSKFKNLNKYHHHRQQYISGAATNHRQIKDDLNSGEDTNERYCICKDVSYGDMIMCDNSRCSTQWFHFVCVGLNSAPKGKWFCPLCVEFKKKRKEKNLNSILNSAQNQDNLMGNSILAGSNENLQVEASVFSAKSDNEISALDNKSGLQNQNSLKPVNSFNNSLNNQFISNNSSSNSTN